MAINYKEAYKVNGEHHEGLTFYEQATTEDIDLMIHRVELQEEWLEKRCEALFFMCTPGYFNVHVVRRLNSRLQEIEDELFETATDDLSYACMMAALDKKAHEDMGLKIEDECKVMRDILEKKVRKYHE